MLFLIIRLSVALLTHVRLHLGLNVLFDQVIDVQVVMSLSLLRSRHLGDTLILEEQMLQHILKDGLGVLGLDGCEVDLLTQNDGPRWDTIRVVDGMHVGSRSLATFLNDASAACNLC